MSENSIKGNIITFKGTQKEQPVFIIKFNNSDFTYVSTRGLQGDKNELNEPFELLPSIYCTIKKRCDDDLQERYYNKYMNSSNFVKKSPFLLTMLINNYRYNNQDIEIILEIKNKRDNIEVSEGIFNDTNLIYKNKDDSLYEKTNKDRSESNYNVSKPLGMYVDTEKIFYPQAMGGGANRCIVWNIFQTLNLMNTFKEDYKAFDVNTMLEASSYNEEILELCSNYDTCSYILEKFRNGTYSTSEGIHDNIELTEYKGYYFPVEGKHRVCIAKRFKIPKIYAEVTGCIDIEKGEEQEDKPLYLKNLNFNSFTEEDILNAHYDVFKNLGLEDDNIKFLTEQGLTDAEVVEYIEKTTKKSLLELSREASEDKSKYKWGN